MSAIPAISSTPATIAAVIGTALAVLMAVARLHAPRVVRVATGAWIELIRNTPFLVQLFFIFFGLPALGLRLGAPLAAAIAMTVNLSAYTAEILRAGILSLPDGQREAGLSLGLRPAQVFRLITLPQAFAAIWPALVSQTVITMLESAVVSQIAVTDLTHAADYIQSINYRAFETYAVVAAVYFLMAQLVRRVASPLGRRVFAGRRRAA